MNCFRRLKEILYDEHLLQHQTRKSHKIMGSGDMLHLWHESLIHLRAYIQSNSSLNRTSLCAVYMDKYKISYRNLSNALLLLAGIHFSYDN